jgi:uncharacterized membrane protein
MAVSSPRNPKKKKQHRYIVAYMGVLFLSVLWCSFLIGTPLLRGGGTVSRRAAALLTLFFSPVCHQIPERSFHISGYPLAVCARCTGIYGGFLLGVLIYPIFKRLEKSALPPRWILVVGILPTIIEMIVSKFKIIDSNPIFSGLSGLILGCIVSFYVLPAVFELTEIR